MSLPRTLRALARPALTSTARLTPSSCSTRAFSQSLTRSGGHGHESQYDPPAGWLFGVKPGEKYEKEGWENLTFWVFIPMMVGFVGVYAFKPDTRYVYTFEREWERKGERGAGWGGTTRERCG